MAVAMVAQKFVLIVVLFILLIIIDATNA
ncbi:YjcZ family sporulation protein [Lysinibacillus sp. JNUCC 51]|nr:YjcZ family sporulation protein [Lysinibacillus sp. JNUCC-51]